MGGGLQAIAANLLGGLWYSPLLFGKPWRALSGISRGDSTMGAPAGVFVASFTLFLISASLLAALLGPNAGGQDGARLGALIGVSFVFTAMGATNLFEHRPLPLILINAGYHIVALSIMGFIIGQWS